MRNVHHEAHDLKPCVVSCPDGHGWFPEGDHMRAALLEKGIKAEGHGTRTGWRPCSERISCLEGFCPDRHGWFPEGLRAALPESQDMKADCPEGHGWRASSLMMIII